MKSKKDLESRFNYCCWGALYLAPKMFRELKY